MQRIFAATALLPGGWADGVAVEIGADGRIASVASGAAAGAGDRRVPVLLPALSNLHSHTFQRAMAGLAEARGPSGRDSFWTWRAVMYRFLDLLSPEEIEAIAAFAFMEMQEAGFAACAEFHYLHHQPGGAPYAGLAELSGRIASAAAETGIGLTLLPVLYRQGGVDGRALAGGQLRFGNGLDSFARLLDEAQASLSSLPKDARLGVAPHSLRAVGPDDLAAAASLRPAAPLHMHIAEQQGEVDEMLAVRGERPMRWLLDRFEVNDRWCLIHATHLQPDETERLAASGAVAGLCPITEANLGDGIFDGERFLASGGRFGVGTDSNIRISAPGELRQLEYSQRLKHRARIVLAGPGRSAGRALYDGALTGGAEALGRQSGAIRPGAWADLVGLDPDRAGFGAFSGDRLVDAWIFASGNELVREVWSAGRHIVREGRHVARDRIGGRYRAVLASIMERL